MVGARLMGAGGWELVFSGDRVSVLQGEELWRGIVVMVAQDMNVLNTTELYN